MQDNQQSKRSLVDECATLSMDELDKLSFTKVVRNNQENTQFIGLGIMDEKGYLLKYEELKRIYAGLHFFIRNASPDLIEKMNEQKILEDEKEKQSNEIIEIVSKHIVEKEELQEEEKGGSSFFKRLFKLGKRGRE